MTAEPTGLPPGGAGAVIGEAEALRARGELAAAIELLTARNRAEPDGAVQRLLVELRSELGGELAHVVRAGAHRDQVAAAEPDGRIVEVGPDELDPAAVADGWARSGCLHVRGLVPTDRTERLVAGIDAVFDAFDAAGGDAPNADGSWFAPLSIPDRKTLAARTTEDPRADHVAEHGLPQRARRRFMRSSGGVVTAESPRMLFELFELVDDLGLGALMTEFLGERPVLSANKCTLRRVEPTVINGGWHQDGAFLGDAVGSFNVWFALSDCGRDAPGLDLVPRRVDRVVASDDEAQFDWSLSERAVREAAGDLEILRPEFRAGDALIFDHRLVHRTAAADGMTSRRYAIESWFFAPSAYPEGQLPIAY